MNPAAKRESRRLKKLVPYPEQQLFFTALSEHDLSSLADDIRRNGLRQAIEILPANSANLPSDTIIRGHERRRALLRNGQTTSEVLVRYDLADADPAEIERAFLEDNLHRRQLDPLAKARAALRMYEIERGRSRTRRPDEDAEARDRVGKAIGMSGRNLARYLRVLTTPMEVQTALSAGQVSLVAAEKVADLPQAKQKAIAQRIAAGESPKAVVTAATATTRREQPTSDPVSDFAAALNRAIADLMKRRHSIDYFTLLEREQDLGRACAVIRRLVDEREI